MLAWIRKLFRWLTSGTHGAGSGSPEPTPVATPSPQIDEASPGSGSVPIERAMPPRRTSLPEWADFFDQLPRLQRFEREVSAFFDRRQIPVEIGDGVVTALGQDRRWGLANVAQLCAASEDEEWRDIIEGHFSAILRDMDAAEPAEPITDYLKIKSAIGPRLWEERSFDGAMLENSVYRRDLPGLITMLSLDLPQAVRAISTEDLGHWAVGEDQAFARAIDNLDHLATPDREVIDIPDGGRLIVLHGESFFVSSYALSLERIPEVIGPHGTILAVPTRHVLIAAAFNDLGVINLLSQMIRLAVQMHRTGPGSISPRAYWRRDIGWLEIPYTLGEQSLEISPPEEFIAVLDQFSEDEDPPESEEPL